MSWPHHIPTPVWESSFLQWSSGPFSPKRFLKGVQVWFPQGSHKVSEWKSNEIRLHQEAWEGTRGLFTLSQIKSTIPITIRIGDCPPCTWCKTLSIESCAAGWVSCRAVQALDCVNCWCSDLGCRWGLARPVAREGKSDPAWKSCGVRRIAELQSSPGPDAARPVGERRSRSRFDAHVSAARTGRCCISVSMWIRIGIALEATPGRTGLVPSNWSHFLPSLHHLSPLLHSRRLISLRSRVM